MLDALGPGLDVAVHHRRGRRHPQPVRMPHHVQPLRAGRLLRRDDLADTIDENLAAAAGDRVEARVAQPAECVGNRELRAPRYVLHLRRRECMQMDPVTALDRAEQILVVVDAEIGMVTTLHQDAGAAERERLFDLLEDDRLRQQVPLATVAGPAVERAEVAVGHADVRVVDVAIDDERHTSRIGAPRPQRVRRSPDRHQLA